jgi:SAM-dependent methyltransferase
VTGTSAPFVFEPTGEAKRFAPATERNRDAIVSVLRDMVPQCGTVLEIASGTGEHIVHFAAAFPHLDWQPRDYDDAGLASIAAWRAESALANIRVPIRIDTMAQDWPISRADAMLCINMIHIAPWDAAKGLFAGAARILSAGGPLYLYGPYRETNIQTAESNEAFDASLKSRTPAWGLRHLNDVIALANQTGFTLDRRVDMPANNLSLVFIKQ